MDAFPAKVWRYIADLIPADEESASRAADLFRELELKGRVSLPAHSIFDLKPSFIADFFQRMERMHSGKSPLLHRRDTRWASEVDYTRLNIRAAGGMLKAAMYLSTLPPRGIVLEPFTLGESSHLESLVSHIILRDDFADARATAAGISLEIQMKAFCKAAHMLKMFLGLSLDYRVSPRAIMVFKRPDLFLWTQNGELNREKEVQTNLRKKVRVAADSSSPAEILKEAGVFPSLSSDGSGRTFIALRELHGKNNAAATYWGKIFNRWQDSHEFDFLFLKGFSQDKDSSGEAPGIEQLKQTANIARRNGVRGNTGVGVRGAIEDANLYDMNGADLLVYEEDSQPTNQDWFSTMYRLEEWVQTINRGRKIRFSVPFTVTLDNNSVPEKNRALLKRFVGRFLFSGAARRPLMETMGAEDGAWGYETSVETNVPMRFPSHAADAAVARRIEQTAEIYSPVLTRGTCLKTYADSRRAWWIIGSRHSLLIAAASVENSQGLPPGSFSIDYKPFLKNKTPTSLVEIDFHKERDILILMNGKKIAVTDIPYQGFRLYTVVLH